MTRYDWPAAPFSRDDPGMRAVHMGRCRPSSQPSTAGPDPAPPPTHQMSGEVMLDAPSGNDNLWVPIGPSVMVNGQATGDPNVAGRIRDLQVEPVNGQRVYAASGAGGCWYSSDRGETWRPLDDFESSDRTAAGDIASALACGSVHVIWGAAVDGSRDEVWVGTGETRLHAGRPTPGSGALPGGMLAGIGFLHAIGPAVGGAWTVVTAETPPGHPNAADSLRGKATYRITGDPGDPLQLVAGTTNGLYLKPFGRDWGKVTVPALNDSTHPLDTAMTRLTGPHRVRIWVASTSALFMAEAAVAPGTAIDPTSLHFNQIAPSAFATSGVGTRLQLATSADGSKLYVLGLRSPRASDDPPGRTTAAAGLWSITAMETPPVITEVGGVPVDLFGDQADYDMCVAVHPDAPNRVYVGGSFVKSHDDYNGGVFRLEVSGTTCTATMIGTGVHADDHVIRVGPAAGSAPKRTVWIGCDGGLFRSDADGDDGTFIARNNGLAVLQPGYVASHPTNDGLVAAGFQDNGTALRVGDTVWEESYKGDGGGIVFDPAGPKRYFRQYIHADWSASDGGIRPVLRRGAWLTATATRLHRQTSETIENEASAFYSGADTVVHGGLTHLAFGTDRVWYSTDWGRSWVTLPTATDPRGRDNPDLDQDVVYPGASGTYTDTIGSTECCSSTWAGTFTGGARAGHILAVKFSAKSDATTHTLRVLTLYYRGLVWFTGTRPVSGSGSFTWTAIPAGGSPTTQAFRGATGASETNSLSNGLPLPFLPAPDLVSDVAVHNPSLGNLGSAYVTTIGTPGFPGAEGSGQVDTLYFFDGTSTWYPCGLRRTTPTSAWTSARVTAPALGVVVDPDDRSIVYVGTSVGAIKGRLSIGVDGSGHPTYSWTWAQLVNGLPEAAVQDLSIYSYAGVKLLRAALSSRGVWETDLANVTTAPLTYLRLYPSDTRRRVPTPLAGPTSAGEDRTPSWDNSPDIVVDTSGTTRPGPPAEAELYKLVKDQTPGFTGKALVDSRDPVVHVLVHHRSGAPALGSDVRVALMLHEMSGDSPVPLGAVWAALLAAKGAAAPPATLPDGWRVAGSSLWQNLAGPVETRMPRAVSFSVDLSGAADRAAFALVAIILNQITDRDVQVAATSTIATTVQGLVQNSPHVAAKSIEFDPSF